MLLNPFEHPVGTRFIGHQWEFESTRGDEPRRSSRALSPWPDDHISGYDIVDPESIPNRTRVPGSNIQEITVLEYSPTGAFARIRPENYDDGGRWVRPSRYEVLEILPPSLMGTRTISTAQEVRCEPRL